MMSTKTKYLKNALCPNINKQIAEPVRKRVTMEKQEECNVAEIPSQIDLPEFSDNLFNRGQHVICNTKQNCKQKRKVLSKVSSLVEINSDESKCVDMGLENVRLMQEIEELRFAKEAMTNSFCEMSRSSEAKYTTLQREVERLAGENAALQTSLMDLEKTSTEQLHALTATVNETSEIIKKQDVEISDLNEVRKSLRNQVEESQNNINQHNKLVKKLKMENSREIEIYKQDAQELNTLKSQKIVLKEQLEYSKMLLKSYKTQFKEMKTQYQQQQTFIRRFEEDLQSCVPLMTKSKELKQKFIDLKSRYLDNNRPVHCSEMPGQEHQAKISFLEKKVETLTRTGQNYAKIKRRMEQKFSETLSTFNRKESHSTQLLCKEKNKSSVLERQLKEQREMVMQLQSANLMSTMSDAQSAPGNLTTVFPPDEEANEN